MANFQRKHIIFNELFWHCQSVIQFISHEIYSIMSSRSYFLSYLNQSRISIQVPRHLLNWTFPLCHRSIFKQPLTGFSFRSPEVSPVATQTLRLKTPSRDSKVPHRHVTLASWHRYSCSRTHCLPSRHAPHPAPGSGGWPPPASTPVGQLPAFLPRFSRQLFCWARPGRWVRCSLPCFSLSCGTCSGISSARWRRRRARWISWEEHTLDSLLAYLQFMVFHCKIFGWHMKKNLKCHIWTFFSSKADGIDSFYQVFIKFTNSITKYLSPI